MRVLLTGATGFVGGALARQLVAAGHSVEAVARSPEKAAELASLGLTLHRGDVTEKETLRRPMTGVDGVFHVAGWYKIGVRDPAAAVQINVNGTRNVLETMKELGVPKGVYTSTLAVNSDTNGRVVDETYRFTGRHISIYDQTKAEAHAIAESFMTGGLPLVIVQPGLVYGPGDTSSVGATLVQFLQRKLPLLPKKTAFAWGYIDDVARGHLLAMERGQAGRNYFLAGPVHTLVEAIEMAESITGIPAPRLRASPGMLKAASALMRVVEPVVRVPADYTAEGLRVIAGTTYLGGNARARAELAWSVRPLRDGLIETLRHEMKLLGMIPNF
jgi:nucleoside-diphosphate-sugar epimerase